MVEFFPGKGEDLDDCILSKDSVKRKRDEVRGDAAKRILQANIAKISNPCTLHWDGKFLKSLTHTGDSVERVAILIQQGDDEVLLGIRIKSIHKMYLKMFI